MLNENLVPEPESPEPFALPVETRPVTVPAERRVVAVELRETEGWSNKKIARHLGVHPSTVGRWFAPPALTGAETKELTP